jgi:long-subunit fatty acid transport protein
MQNLPLSFGAGFYSPFGLGVEWRDNSTFRAMRSELKYLTVNPVVAGQVHPTLSIAVGLTINYSKTTLRQTQLRCEYRGDSSENSKTVALAACRTFPQSFFDLVLL